jgi:hypothetical protein
MATASKYKQRQIARRSTANIDKLAKQYQADIDAMTGQYQTAFTGYQTGVAEKMKTYESQSQAYRRALDAYTADVVAPYNKAVEKFNAERAAYLDESSKLNSGALDRYAGTYEVRTRQGRTSVYTYKIRNPFTGQELDIYGADKDLFQNPEKYGLQMALTPVEGGFRGQNKYTFRPLPTTKLPTEPSKPAEFAMTAPEAPDVGEFDSSEFEQKKRLLGDTFQREVGERRAAKIGAVSRRATRPLLAREEA